MGATAGHTMDIDADNDSDASDSSFFSVNGALSPAQSPTPSPSLRAKSKEAAALNSSGGFIILDDSDESDDEDGFFSPSYRSVTGKSNFNPTPASPHEPAGANSTKSTTTTGTSTTTTHPSSKGSGSACSSAMAVLKSLQRAAAELGMSVGEYEEAIAAAKSHAAQQQDAPSPASPCDFTDNSVNKTATFCAFDDLSKIDPHTAELLARLQSAKGKPSETAVPINDGVGVRFQSEGESSSSASSSLPDVSSSRPQTDSGKPNQMDPMLAALSQLKLNGGRKTSALEIAAAAIAADKDSGVNTDTARKVRKMIPEHYRAKQEQAKQKNAAKKDRREQRERERAEVRAGGAGSEQAQHRRVAAVALARSQNSRNRTTKKKQNLEQQTQILQQDYQGQVFYDSADDMPLKVLKVRRGDAQSNENPRGRQMLFFCSQMRPETGEYDRLDKEGDELILQGKYVIPRAQEARMFGIQVARVFGQLEVKRTKKNGILRSVDSLRNQQSLQRARELVGKGTHSVSTLISDSEGEYDGDSE